MASAIKPFRGIAYSHARYTIFHDDLTGLRLNMAQMGQNSSEILDMQNFTTLKDYDTKLSNLRDELKQKQSKFDSPELDEVTFIILRDECIHLRRQIRLLDRCRSMIKSTLKLVH